MSSMLRAEDFYIDWLEGDFEEYGVDRNERYPDVAVVEGAGDGVDYTEVRETFRRVRKVRATVDSSAPKSLKYKQFINKDSARRRRKQLSEHERHLQHMRRRIAALDLPRERRKNKFDATMHPVLIRRKNHRKSLREIPVRGKRSMKRPKTARTSRSSSGRRSARSARRPTTSSGSRSRPTRIIIDWASFETESALWDAVLNKICTEKIFKDRELENLITDVRLSSELSLDAIDRVIQRVRTEFDVKSPSSKRRRSSQHSTPQSTGVVTPMTLKRGQDGKYSLEQGEPRRLKEIFDANASESEDSQESDDSDDGYVPDVMGAPSRPDQDGDDSALFAQTVTTLSLGDMARDDELASPLDEPASPLSPHHTASSPPTKASFDLCGSFFE